MSTPLAHVTEKWETGPATRTSAKMNQCLATVAATLPDGREQALVREFFAGVHSGFFVEVGADRPQQESQTCHLEQLGWTGILVEPQPDLAEELRRKRSAQVFAV